MDEQKARILVVDDIDANRRILKELVGFLGHDVELADNGLSAIEMMESCPPDLVLLDIFMPKMDGYEVLSRMKSHEKLQLIPVVMVTAMDDMESIVRCLERGADDYMVKPFNPTLMRARIKGCLERKRLLDRNEELLNEVVARQAVMKMELELAQKVQESMLPSREKLDSFKNCEIGAFYKAATSIGGDFYDCFEYGHDKLAFLLADVSGHGPSAALTVSAMRTIIEEEKAYCPYPGQFVKVLNNKLRKVIPEDCFATVFFGVADFSIGQLTFVCAGHPSPFIFGENMETVEVLEAPGMPVGMLEDAIFSESSIPFSRGDKIMIYSDGTFETKGKEGELYGIDRMKSVVKELKEKSPSGIIDYLVDDIENHWDGQSERDDIAVLLAKFI